MPCYSPLRGYRDRETNGIVFRKNNAGGDMEVACGSCLGCRLDRSRTWAIRITHEASQHDQNCFITLTYDPEKLPHDGSLRKSDFQKFMKRLRKAFPERKIRYYHCGEYGQDLDRPHYHACLFNLDFSDKQLLDERDGKSLFVSQTLSDIWGLGFTTVGELTFESAGYVARYCLKKVDGKQAHDHYLRCDENGEAFWLQPEYTTMSRGHRCKSCRENGIDPECTKCSGGIGRDWYEKYEKDVFPSDETPVPGVGVLPKAPRYYEEILRKSDPALYERIKRTRKKFREKHKEEYTTQRLHDKYKVKKAQIRTLQRDLEK